MNFLTQILDNFSLKNEKENHQKVIDDIDKGVVFKGTNLWILVFAIFIASLGLNVNSTAVIIGAMLVSPLMGPIMGMGLSLGINDLDLLKKALRNYTFATVVGLLTSTLYFSITPLNEAHSEILARTQPNIYDVLIALFGGLAGIVATSSRQKGNVITGVAIATALMPPLCTAGYGLATLNLGYFVGAFYLYFINTVFIAFATLITVKFLDFPLKHLSDKVADKKSQRIILGIVLFTLIPSLYFGYDTIQQARFKSKVQKFIENECKLKNDYLLSKNIDPASKSVLLIYGGDRIDEAQKNLIYSKLKYYDLEGTTLKIQQGFANDSENTLNPAQQMMNASLLELESENQAMRTKLDSVLIKKNDVSQILKEIKVIYPQISTIILQPSIQFDGSLEKKILVSIIKTNKDLSKEERNKLNIWLKIRLKNENLKLIIE